MHRSLLTHTFTLDLGGCQMKMEAKQKLDGRVFGDLTSNELKFLTPALSG